MGEAEIILEGYRFLFGDTEVRITPLPKSGSDRKYFRISTGERSMIGAYNPVKEENEAFIGFTRHFISKGLRVPEIYGYMPERNIYFLQDLGDTNLFTWIRNNGDRTEINAETRGIYRKVLDHLILFQTVGIQGLDLDLCYPHRSFDRQSMMWDMNYFKYNFLKLISISFNEKHLEHDFNILADFLLETPQDYFLYRDFQTANIMILEGVPWFIDYQGGRLGASQYDVASLLYDAKIKMSAQSREELLDHFTSGFCTVSGEDRNRYMSYYKGFSMIRIMQALGAFGLRGLYEKKPTFTESIVPGVDLLLDVINTAEKRVILPELYNIIRSIPGSGIYKQLSSHNLK